MDRGFLLKQKKKQRKQKKREKKKQKKRERVQGRGGAAQGDPSGGQCVICFDGAKPGAPLLRSTSTFRQTYQRRSCRCVYEAHYACVVSRVVGSGPACPVCHGPEDAPLSPIDAEMRGAVESWLRDPGAPVPDTGMMARQCLWAMYQLAKGSDDVREQLMRVDAAARIVAVMEAHQHAENAARGCCVIALLAGRNNDSCEQFLRAGAVERIVAALEAHVLDADVASAGCVAIQALVSCGGTREQQFITHPDVAMRAGAAPRILAALQAHACDAHVVELGCTAIGALAQGSNDRRSALKALGAEEVLDVLAQSHRDYARESAASALALLREEWDVAQQMMKMSVNV